MRAPRIEESPLWNRGPSVSRIGVGCWAMGGFGWGDVDDEQSIAAVRKALDLGLNLFDTADVYGFGHAEETLARALGPRRNEVVIATKFGVRWDARGRTKRDISPEWLFQAVEGSLRRLRLDCIPLYQIHWPDGRTRIECVMEALERCVEEGKIQHVGCCNFTSDQIQRANACFPLRTVQSSFNLLDRAATRSLLPLCEGLGLGFLSYGSLALGLLSGKYRHNEVRFDSDDVRSNSAYFAEDELASNLEVVEHLHSVAKRYDKTIAQVALRWILDTPGVVGALVGIRKTRQIEENVGALGWSLDPADWASLGREAFAATVNEPPKTR
jgi:aryl-alcohol dehydrogenase-like predicted oxidoreductase